jgi:hypothetical protein
MPILTLWLMFSALSKYKRLKSLKKWSLISTFTLQILP